MNKICKTYISEVKAFFPILGKDERSYISKLRTNVDDLCDEANISTKEELYKQYGMPMDVVHDYYSSVDTESVIKRIRLTKYIKSFCLIVLVLSIVAVTGYCLALFHDYRMVTNEEIYFHEENTVNSIVTE